MTQKKGTDQKVKRTTTSCCGGESKQPMMAGMGPGKDSDVIDVSPKPYCGGGSGKDNTRSERSVELDIKEIVRTNYGKIASQGNSCCSPIPMTDEQVSEISKAIGYSDDEIEEFADANLGLGCGNPTALAGLREGDVVLDLGSGAGFDAFLAARKVGSTGKVIGVDMTQEMLEKARENATKMGFTNTEFRKGDIEELPVEDGSIDVIISNCVINLAPDKLKVFREAYRVLRKGGRMYVSDIVLLEELPEEARRNEMLITGCVGGALLKDDYLGKMRSAGFDVHILEEDREISKTQYMGINLESLKVEAVKDRTS